MAVTASEVMRRRLWRGYDDPGLPVGMWFSWVQSTGDVSGGDNTLIIEFEPVEISTGLSGNFYNVEQLEITSTVNSNTDGLLSAINFAPRIGGATFNRHLSTEIASNEGSVASIELADQLQHPWFLGGPVLPTVTPSLRYTQDNNDGETVIFWAEGYIWSARSTQSEGGLRRPADSLYG